MGKRKSPVGKRKRWVPPKNPPRRPVIFTYTPSLLETNADLRKLMEHPTTSAYQKRQISAMIEKNEQEYKNL